MKKFLFLLTPLLLIGVFFSLTSSPVVAGTGCPHGGDWIKLDGLSGFSAGYTAPEGWLIDQTCYKAGSHSPVFGSVNPPAASAGVSSGVYNSPGGVVCTGTGEPVEGCALQELSHASFHLIPAGDPTATPVVVDPTATLLAGLVGCKAENREILPEEFKEITYTQEVIEEEVTPTEVRPTAIPEIQRSVVEMLGWKEGEIYNYDLDLEGLNEELNLTIELFADSEEAYKELLNGRYAYWRDINGKDWTGVAFVYQDVLVINTHHNMFTNWEEAGNLGDFLINNVGDLGSIDLGKYRIVFKKAVLGEYEGDHYNIPNFGEYPIMFVTCIERWNDDRLIVYAVLEERVGDVE